MSKEFLYRLLTTPSPSGYERKIQREVRAYLSASRAEVSTDLYGNVIAGINTGAPLRVMLSGHADQIGYMVRHISKDGFISLSKIGGIDAAVLPGSRLFIHTAKKSIPGIVGRKAIHLQSAEERERMKIDIDKLWLDIGARSQKEAEAHVRIGDPVTYELGVLELPNALISSPGIDNKVGQYVAIETLKRCAGIKLPVALFAVSSVQEELGCRGIKTAAYAIDPRVGIAIDVCHATDNPAAEGMKDAPNVLGGGPALSRGPGTNPVLEEFLHACARKKKIRVQLDPKERPPSNEAREMQVSRAGMATASIGIPTRYMHTQTEVACLDDIEAAVDLLVATISSMDKKHDFTPL